MLCCFQNGFQIPVPSSLGSTLVVPSLLICARPSSTSHQAPLNQLPPEAQLSLLPMTITPVAACSALMKSLLLPVELQAATEMKPSGASAFLMMAPNFAAWL